MVRNLSSYPRFTSLKLNPGRFLHGLLADLWKWHQDEELFKQDNRVKVGGKYYIHPGFLRAWTTIQPLTPDKLLTWAEFKIVVRKWHHKIALVSFRTSTPVLSFN